MTEGQYRKYFHVEGIKGVILSVVHLTAVIALFYSPRLSIEQNPVIFVGLTVFVLIGAFRFFPNSFTSTSEVTREGLTANLKHPAFFTFLIGCWSFLLYPFLVFREATSFDNFVFPHLYLYALTMGAIGKMMWSCLDVFNPFAKVKAELEGSGGFSSSTPPEKEKPGMDPMLKGFIAGIGISLAKREAQKIADEAARKKFDNAEEKYRRPG
jgi:uncharacterized protein with PQ loop repeat